jgi:hypothetical protein
MGNDREAVKTQRPATPQPKRAPDAANRGRQSSVESAVLDLQRTAGNAAVGQAIAPKPKNSMALQLGAVWNDQVTLPLAKASERLSREQPDLDGAAPLLDEGLRGIRLVKAATPADDQNFTRIEILERRVEAVRSLVAEQRGNQVPVEKEMIRLRAEAADVGTELKYAPKLDGSEAPHPADKAALAEFWQAGVIKHMWQGQQEAQDSPVVARISLRLAATNILRLRNGIPDGEPATRLKLVKLYDGLEGITAILDERSGSDVSRLRDLAIDAYGTAEVVGKWITGQSVDDDEVAEKFDPNEEPAFTYERERPPFKDDTALERPGDSASP